MTFQLGVLGGTGVLFLASTVLAGVLNAIRVPLTSVAAVIWFHDPMSGFKDHTAAIVLHYYINNFEVEINVGGRKTLRSTETEYEPPSVAAVIWFHDPMSGFKILSLVITV
ncbi:hypothetical protein EJB05_43949, partial [Eragrostis curvula]